jgi:hypothetical protein
MPLDELSLAYASAVVVIVPRLKKALYKTEVAGKTGPIRLGTHCEHT